MINYSDKTRLRKLSLLYEDQGLETEEEKMSYLQTIVFDSVSPGICMNPDCDYITDCIEPDASDGWCKECETNSIASILVLEEII